ncbi:MAG: alpha/beta fold hydrolase [Syntrophales bacterium]|nr:alpha/beta fold hydrolase [Syntrophales bacterium]
MPMANVNGIHLHYRFDGPATGTVVLLSNSLASDLHMWDRQVPALVEAGYRVLRYDSRGHGRSDVPAGPYTFEVLTADALGLMDAFGLTKIHFCGLSMGGMVGQMLGTKHGSRLLSLVLASTAAVMPDTKILDERSAAVRKGGMAVWAGPAIDRWFTKTGQERLKADVERVRQTILRTSVEGFCASSAALSTMDQRESIRAITMPTLILVGEKDPGTPPASSKFIHERIASSTLRIIPGAAHFVNVEQADLFNGALLGFLGRQDAV